MKVAILKNETDGGVKNWVQAIKKYDIEYDIIDLISNTWLKKIESNDYDAFLACPPGAETRYKVLYDEKIYILEKIMNKFIYPSFAEISIYENKRYLSFWLMASKLPHPETNVFYYKREAIDYIKSTKFPVVGKFNIGASGKGVRILKKEEEALEYVITAFSSKGLRQSWGPNLKMGFYAQRLLNVLKKPSIIGEKIKVYKKTYNETQKDFVIFQEFIPHEFEWRVVKIGDSYFGHQKIKQGDKASGTKGIDYIAPPVKLLHFVRNLCQRYGFNSMAVDLFEDGKGGYVINELQTIFGHVQEYICEKNGKPGRFRYYKNSWVFEEGFFNSNLSYDLRMEDVINLLQNND